jgi:hypothetical protein
MQSWQQPLTMTYYESNPTDRYKSGQSQMHWDSARPSLQTEPWTFGKQSGPMPLVAHRQTLHKALPTIEDERYDLQYYPAHQAKARSLAMSVTELVAPDNTPRPVTAPASLNPMAQQAFRAAHYPSENKTFVAPTASHDQPSRTFHSTGCAHQPPCLLGGLEHVATQYSGVPADGWRALDKLADLTMVSAASSTPSFFPNS